MSGRRQSEQSPSAEIQLCLWTSCLQCQTGKMLCAIQPPPECFGWVGSRKKTGAGRTEDSRRPFHVCWFGNVRSCKGARSIRKSTKRTFEPHAGLYGLVLVSGGTAMWHMN